VLEILEPAVGGGAEAVARVVVQRGERLLHRRRRKGRQPGEGRDGNRDHERIAPQRPRVGGGGGQAEVGTSAWSRGGSGLE
jgi:hypothetical protein